MHKAQKYLPSFYILTAIFLWSSLGIFVRLSNVPVHVLIFYAMIVSVCIQSVIVFSGKHRKDIPKRGKIIYPIITGGILLVNTFTYFFAFQNTTIANAVLTHYTAPVLVAIFAPLLLREQIAKQAFFAIVIASGGLWIMLDGFSIEGTQAAGIISGLLSGIAYAALMLFVRFHAQRIPPVVYALFTNATIVCLLAPFIREFPASAVWIFLVMGIVHSTIAPLFYYTGLRTVPANKAAILGYLEPVCAIFLGVLFLNEGITARTLIGGFLIIFSGYLTLRS